MSKMTLEIVLGDDAKKLLAALTKAAAGTAKPKAKEVEETDDTDDADAFGEADDANDDTDATDDDDTDGEGDNDGEGDGDGDAEGDGPTREDVRDALKAYAKAVKSQDKAVAAMKKVGGTEHLSKLKEGKFQALIDHLKKLTKAAKSK